MKGDEVPVTCHVCGGKGYIWEIHAHTKKEFKAICPECNGDGFVLVKSFE